MNHVFEIIHTIYSLIMMTLSIYDSIYMLVTASSKPENFFSQSTEEEKYSEGDFHSNL